MPKDTARQIAEFIIPMRVRPDSQVNLEADFDPAYKGDLVSKEDGRLLLQQGVAILEEYQTRPGAAKGRTAFRFASSRQRRWPVRTEPSGM